MNDAVEHPAHYCEGRKYEPWDVIIDWKLDYLTGSAMKYIARAGRKDDHIQDLEKAIAYLQKRIEVEKATISKMETVEKDTTKNVIL